MLGRAGWPRITSDGIDYRLHDYGTVEPGHAFTYWPGFSLNPGMWDVRRLQCAFFESFGEPPVFNSTDALRAVLFLAGLRRWDSRGVIYRACPSSRTREWTRRRSTRWAGGSTNLSRGPSTGRWAGRSSSVNFPARRSDATLLPQ